MATTGSGGRLDTGVTIPLYTKESMQPGAEHVSLDGGLKNGMYAHVQVVGLAGAADRTVAATPSQTASAGAPSDKPAADTSLFQVDTGSWATVLPVEMVRAAVADFDLSAYPTGSLEYSSSSNVETGRWVPLVLAFPDARLPDGTVPTTTVTALVRPEGSGTHMLGIGFNTTYATNVVGQTLTSAHNAALNLAAMKDGDMGHSYMIDQNGLHLGWSIADQGAGWTVQTLEGTGVTQPEGSPTDWLFPTGDVTIDGTVHHDVSMLFDTGTPKAFVHYDGATRGHDLRDGRDISVSVPGAHEDPISYGFVTGDGGGETPAGVHVSPATHGPQNFMNTGANFFREYSYAYDADRGLVAFSASDPDQSPTMAQQVSFLNGLFPDGTLDANSFAGLNGKTAHKWGAPLAGEGATITFAFDPASGFTETEQATVLRAMAVWEGVADIRFVAAAGDSPDAQADGADVLIHRDDDGGGHTSNPSSLGSGRTLGSYQSQVVVSLNTNTDSLSGSLTTEVGHGFGSIVHELGHALGLGHAGFYNKHVDPAEQQFSAYDNKLWSLMSYISWAQDNLARYGDAYPVTGTYWGIADGDDRTSPQSVMQLDILAIQQLYGAAKSGPFSHGNTTYGFNTTVTGTLRSIYDFAANQNPVLTLYNKGTDNTLDLSGFRQDATIDLRAGAFSSAGGLVNNIAIAQGTMIETAIGGRGNDAITGNTADNVLNGKAGADVMSGLTGSDLYFVDNGGDRVLEAEHEGNDTVQTKVSYTLEGKQHIENLVAEIPGSTQALTLIGNEFAQTIRGNAGHNQIDGRAGADFMYGWGGNDTYRVDDAGDRVFELRDSGHDRVFTTVGYALQVGQSIEELAVLDRHGTKGLRLTGNEHDQKLRGNAGDNVLDGRGGADALHGLRGDDRYVVDDARDQVFERADEGLDTVLSQVSYALAAGQRIEVLQFHPTAGAADYDLTGNEFAQTIRGNGGANRLDGGRGMDTLTGKSGTDTFVFSTKLWAGNVDHVTDFSTVNDTLELSQDIFTALAPGVLKAEAFKEIGTGRGKVDADDRILYDRDSGALFYDADGSGQTKAVKFAVLDNHAGLTHADILVA